MSIVAISETAGSLGNEIGRRVAEHLGYRFADREIIAKASEPMPLLVGSTTVRVIAVATAASTALPPFSIIESPACAAIGCEVATTFRARTGMRCEGYGNVQSNGMEGE